MSSLLKNFSSTKRLFESIGNNTILLTPNQRLATYLHYEYTVLQKNKGLDTWPTPPIFALETWLENCWLTQTSLTTKIFPHLLTAQQELIVWQQIIKDSTQSTLQPLATAQLAQRAWSLLAQWNLPLSQYQNYLFNEDIKCFYHWGKEFAKRCEQSSWLSRARLATQLQNEKFKLSNKESLVLLGFDEITPQMQNFFAKLSQQGNQIHQAQLQRPSPDTKQLITSTWQNELQQMAHWAKQQLEINPSYRIGCVVPKLTERRHKVEQIFNDVLSADIYNISAGIALTHYPMTHAALKILELGQQRYQLTHISSLLRSPFIAAAKQELLLRANIDKQLHNDEQLTVDLTKLLTVCEHSQLYDSLFKLKALLPKSTNQLFPSQWANLFNQWLTCMGWPGDQQLSNEESQLYERWQKLLFELMSLDSVLAKLTFNAALNQLKQLAISTTFQPKRAAQSASIPIQISGLLEASGQLFDQLWISELHSENWPTSPSPNPFIPKQLQHGFALPHANAQRELTVCLQMTQRLQHSADRVLFSYPQQEDDKQFYSSPLLKHLSEVSLEQLNIKINPVSSNSEQHENALERLCDEQGPSLLVNEKIQGGTRILQNQAACPFRAFAEHRLGAIAVNQPHQGLDAKQRGLIVHSVLEIVWKKLKNQNNLHEFDENSLENLFINAIEASLLTISRKFPISKTLKHLEKKRLLTFFKRWFELEKQRPNFKVFALEKRLQVKVATLLLTIQIDRIDQLDNGDKLIIDYKTGNPSILAWFGSRPEEPQLPIYSLNQQLQPQALAFAQLTSNTMKLIGISQHQTEINGIKPIEKVNNEKNSVTWQQQMSHWQTTLTDLAEQFSAGIASVDPKNHNTTCTYCNLKNLCRIYEYNN